MYKSAQLRGMSLRKKLIKFDNFIRKLFLGEMEILKK